MLIQVIVRVRCEPLWIMKDVVESPSPARIVVHEALRADGVQAIIDSAREVRCSSAVEAHHRVLGASSASLPDLLRSLGIVAEAPLAEAAAEVVVALGAQNQAKLCLKFHHQFVRNKPSTKPKSKKARRMRTPTTLQRKKWRLPTWLTALNHLDSNVK